MGMARRSVWVQWRQSAILLEVVWGDRVNVDNGRGQSDMVWKLVWGMVGVSMGWQLGQTGEMVVVKEVWRQKWEQDVTSLGSSTPSQGSNTRRFAHAHM